MEEMMNIWDPTNTGSWLLGITLLLGMIVLLSMSLNKIQEISHKREMKNHAIARDEFEREMRTLAERALGITCEGETVTLYITVFATNSKVRVKKIRMSSNEFLLNKTFPAWMTEYGITLPESDEDTLELTCAQKLPMNILRSLHSGKIPEIVTALALA